MPLSKSDQTRISQKRKNFQKELMRPSAERGKVICRLCDKEIWGPNGRHHIDSCPKIQRARRDALQNNCKLAYIGNLTIDDDLFETPCVPKPKRAKFEGFVKSSSALRSNPNSAPFPGEEKDSQKTGRKGYNRCLKCNEEIFAPNTKYHVCKSGPSARGDKGT